MSQKVIDLLNAARSRELAAISQYMIQHYELEDSDFGKLAKKMKEIAIQEMKHAEALAERILFLKGTPMTKPDAEAKKGLEIEAMLTTDIALESQAIKMYNEAGKPAPRKKTRFPNNCSKNSSVKRKNISISSKTPRNISRNWGLYTWPASPAHENKMTAPSPA
ncbi:MAG: ferritin-like domain-containing protein [Deltaproteobacteria bacterium]|nr:ferritin-like domain-containing protein [Deltaproteobacteria bacterium]MDO9210331.1 ferritin-like domain-containing protein [Deltaproteobacteria bacterium]